MVQVVLENDEILNVDSRYDRELSCTKVGNWRLWDVHDGNKYTLLAGQFDDPKIKKIIIDGVEIVLT